MARTNDDRADADRSRRRHIGIDIPGAPVGTLLLQVIRAHARVGTALLNAAGVPPPHEIILFYVHEHGPVPQTELVRYLTRDRSTVTATLQAMERAGLIVRTPSPSDKRAMIVDLTDKGREAVPRAKAAWRELEHRTTRTLTRAQRAALVAALTVVRDALNDDPVD